MQVRIIVCNPEADARRQVLSLSRRASAPESIFCERREKWLLELRWNGAAVCMYSMKTAACFL